MTLDTYAHLQTAIADWLNRSDLTAVIPDFVTLAEGEMKRRLRRTTVRDTIDIDDVAVDVPADLAELRSIYLVTGSPTEDVPIRVGTPEMIAERRARAGGVTGRPTDVCVTAGQFLFAPAPDQTYTAEVIYFASLDPLTTTTTTNDVLDEAPDAYLFGALLQAEPYLEHDERIGTWRERFDRAIDQLNEVRSNEEYAASIRSVRLPVTFG